MSYIVDIQLAFPENYYSQSELVESLCEVWKHKVNNLNRVKLIHANVKVSKRHIACEIKHYIQKRSFDENNELFIKTATEISTDAIEKVLKENNLTANDISSLWSNTVTGFAIPSLESRVMNRLPFKTNTKRVPLLGLGCMAGVAGINRVSDYLKGHPKEAVIFFSVELCSLTFQLEDTSAANMVATGLFGDGAAAVLMVGEEHPLKEKASLKWEASQSIFFPNSQDTMGWKVGSSGLNIVLSKSVPNVVKDQLKGPLMHFLEEHKLDLKDIKNFMAHPGGPKVLESMEEIFDLPAKGLIHSWESLSENGNMSSVSVLDIIKRTIRTKREEKSGDFALSVAMGPGFSAEIGLFTWM
jgi:alkylresorcinol/alkylpyrone synthase